MILRTILSLAMFAAAGLGANYQLCFLEDGPKAGSFDKTVATEMQAAHMKNMEVMFKAGVLEGAGPIGGAPGLRGIFLFGGSLEEAKRITIPDPKLSSGDLKMTCQTWSGPNGVGKAYREAYAKPGFANKMARRVAVLIKRPMSGGALPKSIVSGPLTDGEFEFFAVLDTDDLAKVKADLPEAKAFIWFHDIQVWLGVS